MTTTITIDGTSIDYRDFEIEVPTSSVDIAPSATIQITSATTIQAADNVVIDIDGTTVFDGEARSGGTKRGNGQTKVVAAHEARNLFEETVDISLTTPDTDAVLQQALDNANSGSSFTLDYSGTPISLGNDYDVSNRTVKRVFRDIMDRTSRVWWVDPGGSTIHVEPVGDRGLWQSIDTNADSAQLQRFDTGNLDSIRNTVTVIGTGEEAVSATATDSTSISTYGRRPGNSPYNVAWVTTSGEASAVASELLVPDPLPEGTLLAGANVGDVTQPLANFEVDVTDNAKNVSATGLVVEKQTIEQSRATLELGAGSGVSIEEVNRRTKSREDNTEPGSVFGNDRIADDAVDTAQLVDTAVIESKLADAAVATAKLENNAVINGKLSDLSVSETKIQDDSIATPKLQASAVTANEIESDTITASEIAAGTITATEILADTITAGEINGGTITATEIAADTLTANEVDTLDLDTNELSIGNETTDQIVFDTDSGYARAKPSTAGEGAIGTQTTKFGAFWGNFGEFDLLRGDELRISGGTVAARFEPDLASGAIEITDDDGVTSASDAAIIPGQDDDGMLGAGDGTNTDRAWQEIHTTNLYQYSPQPLDPAPDGVSKTDVSPCRTADGPGNVDLSTLTDHCWDNPPEYVSQGERPDGSYAVDEGAVEHGHLLNYLWETCKAQQETIDDLEERLSRLESQI